jgi:serine/threonine-protein kinase
MELPARIGKYELLEFLGGGMSQVYRARDTVICRTVALKILTQEGCADADTKARFLQEARMAGGASHENVVNIYDFGEEQGRPFLVMEFLDGESLGTLIRESRTGDLVTKLNLARQLARALEYIHQQGIIHRDVKPDNVHVTRKGQVKLMDFGIAKVGGLSITRAGYVLGTPFYMAPEQVQGTSLTPFADIYSFGILLFELLTGSKPFEAATVEQIFYAILHEPVNLERLAEAGIPPAVRELVGRCASKEIAARPQNFGEIAAELERLISAISASPHTGSNSRQAPGPIPKAVRWSIAAAGAALILLAVLAYVGLRKHVKPPAPVGPALPNTLSTSTGEMVLVPGGKFLSGPKRRSASVPTFYIDRTEVTNDSYARFCRATGRQLPASFPEKRPNYPVSDITIADAMEFAKWAGKRLPRMLEWEKAARGTDGRTYPWGNDGARERANLREYASKAPGLMPVESFAESKSPFGTLNMIGNAWEYVDGLWPPSPEALKNFPGESRTAPWYRIRGGSYGVSIREALTWEWASYPADRPSPDVGFRCAKDP